MKKKLSIIIFLFSLLAALPCISIPAKAVTLEKTAKLVPPETILLFDIEDFGRLETQFKKTSLYKFYKDPAMAAFFEHVKSEWRKDNTELQKDFDRIFSEIDSLPQGRVTLVMILNEQIKNANEPPILFLTQWGPAIEKIKTAMNKFVEVETEKGLRKKTDDYRGVTITSLLTEESSEDFNFCFIDDCFIGSFNPELLQFVIAHIQGAGSPTLADDDDYNATVRAIASRGVRSEGQADLYINFKQIVRTITNEDTSGKVKTIVNNLGLDNVTSLSCSIDFAGQASGNSSAKAILKIDGPKKGICKMLDIQSAPLRTPRFISDSTCSISFINIDIKKAFEELTNILNQFSPQYSTLMFMPLLPPSPQGEPAVQLKADVIDHFGSQIIIAQNIEKQSSNIAALSTTDVPSIPQVKSLFAMAINNRNALERSLSTLHSKIIAPGESESRRQLLGYTLYLLDPSSLMPGLTGPMTPMLGGGTSTNTRAALGESAPQIPKMAFTITDTHLLFADESVVESAIRLLSGSQSRSIDSVDWFRKAKSSIPTTVGLAGLEDNAATVEYYWSAMRQMSKTYKNMAGNSQSGQGRLSFDPDQDGTVDRYRGGPGGNLPEMMLPEVGRDTFDFNLLPEFDAFRKYFGLSGFYGLSISEGFFFEIKFLNP